MQKYGPERTRVRSKHGLFIFNNLYRYKVSPLLPILRDLSRSLHLHPSAAQGYMPSHLPSNQTSIYPAVVFHLTSVIIALLAIRCSSILPLCPSHLNTHWSILYTRQLSLSQVIYEHLHSKLYPFVSFLSHFVNTWSQAHSLFVSAGLHIPQSIAHAM